MAKEKASTIIGKVVYIRKDSEFPDVDVEFLPKLNGKKTTKVVFFDSPETVKVGKRCIAGNYIHACGFEDKDGIHAQYAAIFTNGGKK